MSSHDNLFRSPESVLRAKSLAIVGASERSDWARTIYRNLQDFNYPGRIVLVNPNQKEVFGQPCIPSLKDAPHPIEHAVVIVPAFAVPAVLNEAEASGIGSATVYAAAMGDGHDPESLKRGAWLDEFLRTSKLKVAGPNCMGAHSYHERLFAYPNSDLCRVPAGSVGCVFQSGGMLQFWSRTAADRGLRFSYGITSGNEASFDLADYVNFLVEDEKTRTIVLFVEGFRRPAAFMAAAAKALERGKPILAIKTGVTSKSQAAALSHTGAIAGDYSAYLAMCERYGICVCRSLDDLLETALAFDGQRLPKGPHIGFVTGSGGTVDLLYDYAESEGTSVPDFSEATKAALMPFMQAGIEPKNPLDVGNPRGAKQAADVCEVISRDPNIDMIAWSAMLPTRAGAWSGVEAFQNLLQQTDKPVIGFGRMTYQMPPEKLEQQQQAGFPFLQGLEPTLRALKALWFHASRRGRRPSPPAAAAPSSLAPDNLEAALRRYGIVLPRSHRVVTADEAVVAAGAIGFPVVLKIRSSDILHKTEAGGVALHLGSPEMVRDAAAELARAARASYPGARIEGFLVQEMVSGVEAIVGARVDQLYGPLLLLGSGGTLVELIKDVALRLLPVNVEDIRRMIDGLKLSKLLAGFRGAPRADRAAMESSVQAVASFFLDHRAAIEDIEINPLIVRPDGQGAVAVDVRIIWRRQSSSE